MNYKTTALLPLGWLYGMVVTLRNKFFDMGILKSRSFSIPVIGVGNITVGGTGKTPHIEYLIRLLQTKHSVAVLSRGYKRKTKGFVLADDNTTMEDIGDEPYQMHRKFPDISVAVDEKRCDGVARLSAEEKADVILLDDSYQHRYIKPGLNILLIDSNRMINDDCMLPAGRLREPSKNIDRADMIIVTKCPKEMRPIDYRVLEKNAGVLPFQQLFFTTLEYGELRAMKGHADTPTPMLSDTNVLLLTGIASPRQMMEDVKPMCRTCTPMIFGDHHAFTKEDIRKISDRFNTMPEPRIIVTTEKDETRLLQADGMTEDIQKVTFVLPIQVRFLGDKEKTFNKIITDYVRKDSRNS